MELAVNHRRVIDASALAAGAPSDCGRISSRMTVALRPLMCCGLAVGVCMGAGARAFAADAQDEADNKPGSEVVAAALFNPFGGVGVAAPRPAAASPRAQAGDLGLPLLAALAGFGCVGLLVRKYLD